MMNADNIPDFQKIMYPALKYLGDGSRHTLRDVLIMLSKEFNLSEEELRITVPSGQQTLFKNRVTWAISYMKNAGLVQYVGRAIYQITEAGQKVLAENITNINTAYLKKFEAYKYWQSTFSQPDEKPSPSTGTTITSVSQVKTPEEILGDTMKDLNEKLAFELLDLLKSKSANYFELFVLKLLSRMGYGGIENNNFEVVGQSGDQGIDGIIYQDQFGIDRVYVQAKRWNENKVQSKDIRDFIGSLSLRGTNKGIFITTSDFTDDARKTVLMNPQNRIILIDGPQLTQFAIKYNVGVQVKTEYQLKSLDNDFFDEL
jgi:restriction system protein